MKKPLTSWKNTLRALGRKVNWENVFQAKRNRRLRSQQQDACCELHVETLEPRQMLSAVTVTTTSDVVSDTDGQVSLREALVAAANQPGHDTINFSPDLNGTILLGDTDGSGAIETGETPTPLIIDSDVTIEGPGADKLEISGGNSSLDVIVISSSEEVSAEIRDISIVDSGRHGIRLHESGTALTLDGVRIAGNSVRGISSLDSNLTIVDSEISGNLKHGISFQTKVDGVNRTLAITNSTISGNGNITNPRFSGIFLRSETAATTIQANLTNSTIADNANGPGVATGSGILVSSSPTLADVDVQMRNTIIAGNGMGGRDIFGANLNLLPSSNNVIGVDGTNSFVDGVDGNQVGVTDAGLAPLGNYGGATQTHALLSSSPAINAGDGNYGGVTDQRGFERSGTTDIGAFEYAAPIVVSTLTDEEDGIYGDGDLSLREALSLASTLDGPDTITFTPSLNGTILLGDADGNGVIEAGETATPLVIDSDVAIVGNGADQLEISGGNLAFNVITISAPQPVSAEISNVAIVDSAQHGIHLHDSGTTLTLDSVRVADHASRGVSAHNSDLTVLHSEISNNLSHGISFTTDENGVNRTLTVSNSTISGNANVDSASQAGIFARAQTDTPTIKVQLTNSTITDNANGTGNGSGGGIRLGTSPTLATIDVEMYNTIVAGNGQGLRDIVGDMNLLDSSHNLVGFDGFNTFVDGVDGNQVGVADPGLAPLSDNGGPTQTHALLPSSLAINAGDNNHGGTTDQRGEGFSRVIDGTVDIGAYETWAVGTISGTKYHDLNANGVRDTDLIAGDEPDVVFVIDVSGSTVNNVFQGDAVGDINGDGVSVNGNVNTILDGELKGFIDLNQHLIDLGFGDVGSVSIVVFGTSGSILDMDGDPNNGSEILSISPATDTDGDGQTDVEEILRSIQAGQQMGIGGWTNYEDALTETISVLNQLNPGDGNDNVIFLSDGNPIVDNVTQTFTNDYGDEWQTIVGTGTGELDANFRAFGAGTGASLSTLQELDSNAINFTTTNQLLEVFNGLEGSSTMFVEPPLANRTLYLDLNNDGVLQANEPSVLTAEDDPATPDIDETGTYSFTGLAPGQYVVREQVPVGWVITEPTIPNGVDHYVITVGLGDDIESINFGNVEAPYVSISDLQVAEGDSGLTDAPLTVHLREIDTTTGLPVAATLNTNVTVNFVIEPMDATAGTDYQVLATSSIDILAGATEGVIDLKLIAEQLVEADESFRVRLTDVTAADGSLLGIFGDSAVITIQNDDSAKVSIAQATATVDEDSGAVSLDLILDHPVDQDVQVTYELLQSSALPGEDYEATAVHMVTIPANTTSLPISVAILDDNIVESDENFKVVITQVTSVGRDVSADAAADSTLVTIQDDDAAVVSISPTSLAQNELDSGSVDFTFTVSLSQQVDIPIDVSAFLIDVTTTAGEDYVQPSVTDLVFQPGGPLTQTVVITTLGDTLVEPDEDFQVSLWIPTTQGRDITLSNSVATGTILNDDLPTVITEAHRLVTTDADPSANGVTTEFTVPAGAAALRVSFSDLSFDAAAQSVPGAPDINDAFEIAILNQDGMPALGSIFGDSDALFNMTQGEAPIWASGVELLDANGNLVSNPGTNLTDGSVQIDISSLAAGTTLQLVARLVNNDSDDTTSVAVSFLEGYAQQGKYVMLGAGEGKRIRVCGE